MATNDDQTSNPYAKYLEQPAAAPAVPDPAAPNPYAKYVDPAYRAPPRNSAIGTIRDLALDAVGGALDIGKQGYGLANLATGGTLDPASRALTGAAGRGVSAVGNLVTGQQLDGPTDEQAPSIAQGMQRLDEGLAGAQTPFRQQVQQQRAQAIAQADGPLDEAKAALSESLGSPTMLAGDIVRSGASMLAPAVGAEAVTARFGPQVFERAAQQALAGGATREAAAAAGQAAVGRLGERAVIGITGVGQVAGGDDVDTINKVLDTSGQALAANPEYQQLIASGLSDVAARDELARQAGLVNAAVAAPISMAASKLTGAGRQLAEVATGHYAGKGVLDLLKGGAREAAQEVLESGGERLGANLGEQQYGDQSTPTWKGVAGDATLGGLAGFFMGAGEHVAGGEHGTQHAVPAQGQQNAPATTPAAAPVVPPGAGPNTRAAAAGLAAGSGAQLFPFNTAEAAQKRANAQTNTTGVAHEVVDHPSVAGSFAVMPVAPEAEAAAGKQQPAATAAPSVAPHDDLADLFGAPVAAAPVTPVDVAAHAAASSPQNELAPPSKGQIEANNAPLGHAKVGGLSVSFENPAGSVRQDKLNDPPQWETTLQDHYGYFKGVAARAPDKEHVDVFVKPGTPKDYSGPAFVVDQNDEDGNFDEPKVILGAASLDDARATYLRNYDAGFENRIRGITQLSMPELKARLKDPNGFMQPQPASIPQSPAVPANGIARESGQPVAADGQGAPTFTTAKGTTYTVNPDGGTVSGKAAGPSQRTFYLTPEDMQKLATPLAGKGGARLGLNFGGANDDTIQLRQTKGADAGKMVRDTLVRPAKAPAVGLHPLEVWRDGTFDIGDQITQMGGAAVQQAPAATGASQQEAAPQVPPAEAPAGSAALSQPEDDQFDLFGEQGAGQSAGTVTPVADAEAPAKAGKPRLAENADDLYRAIKEKTAEGVYVPGHGILNPVVRVLGLPDMRVSNQGVEAIEHGGMGVRAATKAEIDDLHEALEYDQAQVLAMSKWGGNRSDTRSQPVMELHSPSGNAFQQRTNTALPLDQADTGLSLNDKAQQARDQAGPATPAESVRYGLKNMTSERNGARIRDAKKWGFTDDTVPLYYTISDTWAVDVSFPNSEIAFSHGRTGKTGSDLDGAADAFYVNVAQAPNGKWASGFNYGPGYWKAPFSSKQYDTREQAIEGATAGLKQWVRNLDGVADLVDKVAAEAQQQRTGEPAQPGKAPLPNATAPEHVQTGVDDRELDEIVAEFKNAQADMMQGEHPVTNVFQPPKKGEIYRLEKKAGVRTENKNGKKVYHRDAGWMTVEEAKAQIAEWKAHAQAQGEDEDSRSANSRRIVLSLFDLTGKWSQPWEDAGYQVYRFDIQDSDTYEDPETGEEKLVGDVNNMSVEFFSDLFGDFDGNDVYAVLAACPCTDFAGSGAKHFAAKDADGRTVASVKLVHQTLALIEYYKPQIWALENPVGRIEELGGLPPWRLAFDPYQLGDPYTKKTLLWGRFNGDLPIAPVFPSEGTKMHAKYGGKSQATKNARSATPEGFSYSFFMANNAVDHPVMAIANKYDRLDNQLIKKAVEAGIGEDQINDAVEDHYYMDQDDDAANAAIRELLAEHGATVSAAEPQSETDTDRAAALLQSLAHQASRGEPATSAAQVGLRVALQRDSWAEGKTVIQGGEVWNKGNLRATIAPGRDGGMPTITIKQRKLTAKEQAAEEQRQRTEADRQKHRAEARAYWKVGMAAALPGFADVEGSDQKYTMDLPGVIESIDGDTADVRIYAAPEYGYTQEDYPLHGKLARKVPLTELSKYGHGLERLQKIVDEGKLATGDAEVAASVRARTAKVKYPNRNFDLFWQTHPTALEDARDHKWWAEVAFLNMRRGDTFTAGDKTYTVEAIKKIKDGEHTRKGMTLRDDAGGEHTFWPMATEWHRLVPQLAAQLKAEDELPDTAQRPLLDILKRDPAAHVDEQGRVYLRDTAPGEEQPQPGLKKMQKAKETKGAKPGLKQMQEAKAAKDAPAPTVPQAAAPASLFADNKIFTQDAVDKARALLKAKLGQLNSGIDPEMLQAGITIAGAYIEAGVRSFAKFAKAMVSDLGEGVRPYLRSFFEGARHYPGLDTKGMTKPDDIDAAGQLGIDEGDTVEYIGGKTHNLARGDRREVAWVNPHQIGFADGGSASYDSVRRGDWKKVEVAHELVLPQPPTVDERKNAQVLADLAANAGNPVDIDGRFAPGVYGTPEQPLRFVSGMSRPADFTRLFGNGKNVGISVQELSKVAVPLVAKQLAEAQGAYLFVDSGAFSTHMSNVREAEAAANDQRDAAAPRKLDFDALMARYEDLSRAVSKASDGMAMGRMFLVMPDIVGDQAGSLALVKQYADEINGYGLQAIIPLQGGELTLTEAYQQMMRNLGMQPDDHAPIIGIPTQELAVSNEELTDLLRQYGDSINGVHILGAASDARLQPRLAAIEASGYDGNVSADANRIRALITEERPRKQAFKHLNQSNMADGSPQPRVVRDDQRPEPGKPLSELQKRKRSAETVEPSEKTPQKYGPSGRAALAKMAQRANLSTDPAHDSDSADLVRFFEKYYEAGRDGRQMPKADLHPDDARTAYAAGQKDAAAPAKPKKGFGGATLRQDFGVEHIDGYAETAEFPRENLHYDTPTGGVKEAFIKNARAYLKDVTGMLLDHGFTNATGRDGKALKPVRVNEAGPAVSGEVSLTMYHEGAERGIYIDISGTVGGMMIPATRSGVAVMMRVTKKDDPYSGGQNIFADTKLTAAELADKVRAAVFAASPNRDKLDASAAPNDDKAKDDNGTGPAISDLAAPGVSRTGAGVAAGGQAGTRPAGPLGAPPAADAGAAGSGEGGRPAGAHPDRPHDEGDNGQPASGDGADGRNGTSGTGLVDAGTGVGGPAVGPARANYHIGDPEQLIGGTPKVRFANNRRAIEAYRSITEEGRAPVKADLDAMAAYIGWGSFGQELFQGNWNTPRPKAGWEQEDAWLRGHLGQQEWESAQRSITNAHYTDPITVTTMWNMVRALGFTGGRVLEPAMGIGNFFAMMPLDLAEKSQLTGIEMDALSGGMAKELYPNANIQIKPYQDSKTADGFYDLVIGNWPFDKDGPSDRRYMKLNPSLHDFFFLKALDQTRAGGLVVGITSAGTMDKKGRATRMELAKKGELVAAFRLPSGAFEKYAGTAVVTDIIVLRKRETPGSGLEPWVELGETKVPAGEKIEVNSYYLQHPDHVLGTLNFGHGSTYGRPAMIVERPADLMERLAQLPGKMPAETYQPPASRKQVSYLSNNTDDREGSVTLAKGKLYVVRGERLVPLADEVKYELKDKAKTAQREAQLRQLIAMRTAYGALVVAERAADPKTEALRKDLLGKYQAFTKAYGTLEESDGLRILRGVKDPYYFALASLEINGKPARILREATLRGRKKMANPSVREAFVMARNESMDVNLATIAKLSGKSEAAVAAELEQADAIFKTPAGNYEVADIYLSGNVRRKLREAQDAQANAPAGQATPDFARNIAALERVLPKTVPYFKIEAKLGAPWVKAEHYHDYVARLLGLTRDADKAGVDVAMVNGSWKVKFTDKSLNNRPEAVAQWGTGYRGASLDKMLTAAMNNRSITIKTPDADGNLQVDEAATKEVSEKLVKLREEFGNWIWKDVERRVWLEQNYNEVMNAIATPRFDGSFLEFNGMTLRRGEDPFSLRQHQVNAVWQGLVNGRGLYAHEVGTGKTYTMAGLAVESRRYGLAKKPLIFAHNANSATVAKEFNDMYPAARVLYLDNLTPEDIDVRMRQIANDDWDAVIVPHSLIGRFALTEKTLMEIAAEDIAAMEQEALDAASDDGATLTMAMMNDEDAMKKVRSATAKELVKARNKIIKSIKDMALRSSKESAVSFEDLGIDMVIVDEAHEFKKPPVATKMKMRGLNTGTSNMSIALRFLTDYVKRENNGRGVHLFTGTPITNTLTELYNMMRYVMDDVMKRDGIKDWDSWFNTFADSNTDVELTAAGEYEAVTRLASFVNTAELRRIAGEFMDIVFADDMPEFAPRPTSTGKTMSDTLSDAERDELINGRSEQPVGRPYKKIVVDTAPLGNEQSRMLDHFKALARQFKQATKKERREMMLSGHPASPLLVETGAANAGMDPRLVDMDAADEPNSKVNRLVRNVAALYQRDARATQVVFLERGFVDEATRTKTNPDGTKTVTKVKKFNLVKDMVEKLVAAGVKPGEIAVVDGSTSKEKRKQIADLMNKSKIRVVIGNTKTLGVGVNMQENLRAMHHMDAPWMPGELEQRNGRGWRQGNKWNTVLEYRYITERLDGRRWQVLAVKDRFIKLFLKADENTRIIDGDAVDLEEGEGGGDLAATLSEAAGDPRVLVREKLKADIEKLENRERQHTYALSDAADMARKLATETERLAQQLPLVQADAAQFEAARATFSMTIGGQQYTERPAADAAIAAVEAQLNGDKVTQRQIGSIHGFTLTLQRSLVGYYVKLRGKQTFEAGVASVASIEAALRKLAKTAAETQQKIADNKASYVRMVEMQKEPFGQAALLEKKRKMLADLIADLARNPEPAPGWLRHGAPANTAIYVGGEQRVVEGHKANKDGYFLVTEAGDVPYLDATDASGMPLFEPVNGEERGLTLSAPPNILDVRRQRRAEDRERRGTDPDPDVAKLSRGSAGRGMAHGVVRQLADAIASRWHEAPPVTVVQRVADLPFAAPADTRGAYAQGRVWLVGDNLHTPDEVQFVMAHEVLGHRGLAAILDKQALTQELNRLRLINPELAKAARAQATKYGYDLTLATEEALADMAGEGKAINGWQKFVNLVQRALRAVGLDRAADWIEGRTAAETMSLLRRAREAIEGGQQPHLFGQAQAAAFSDGAPSRWYSALARKVEALPMKAAPAAQWVGTLNGLAKQGVSTEEIEWSGVTDWLRMQDGKVSKAQLLDYLAQNGVRVEEVMHAEPDDTADRETFVDGEVEQDRAAHQREVDEMIADQLGDAAGGHYVAETEDEDGNTVWALRQDASDEDLELFDDEGKAQAAADLANERHDAERETDLRNNATAFDEDAARHRAEREWDQHHASDDTRSYQQYTLPGGEHYTELLLTLPQREPSFALDDYIGELSDKYGWVIDGVLHTPGWSEADLTQEELAKLRRLQQDDLEERAQRANATYQSPHWRATRNVLAHIRVNERRDVDGKRVLFVEELQSDWAADSRRHEVAMRKLRTAVMEAATARGADLAAVAQAFDFISEEPLETTERPTTWAWELLRTATGDTVDLNAIHAIRDDLPKPAAAPFTGQTGAWVALAIKRVIAYAAENGFDTVAFVNGTQSTERFSLRQRVEAIRYVRKDGGKYDVWAADESGAALNRTVDQQGLTPTEVEKFVGVELAAKIFKGEGVEQDGDMVLSGLDLELGGEGMKAFYDQIVPKVANDVLRKLGGGKIGSVFLPDIYREPEMTGLDADGEGVFDDGHSGEQPGFDITPELRATALAGLPLFARDANWGRSVRDPNYRQVVKRTPELQAAAQQLKDGKLSKAEYARLVEQYKPASEYAFVPPPAGEQDMREALSSDKVARIGAPLATLEAGHPVGLRLDIPAYANHGVWVVAVHEQLASFAAGKSIGYDSMAAVTNATFGVVQRAALDIAAGKAKSTIAVIKGSWRPISREKAIEAAQRALALPEWRQVGMHPERHAYFFDRGTMRPVVAADAVIQVGPLVLARNVKYGSMDDVLFSRGDTASVDHVAAGITRRQFLAAAALAATVGRARASAALGKAQALPGDILTQPLPASVAQTLRGTGSGMANPDGAQAVDAALGQIAGHGPVELRALAAQIRSLTPATDTMLTVDDSTAADAHGEVALDGPVAHLKLYTAGGRTGLTYETFLHEALHLAVAARYQTIAAATQRGGSDALQMPAPAAAAAMAQLTDLWQEFGRAVKSRPAPTDKATRVSVVEAVLHQDEFFVRALTDHRLQAYMAGMEYEGKSLLQRFKDWVAGLFVKDGVRPSWLDAALLASGELAGAMPDDRADFARFNALHELPANLTSTQQSAVDAVLFSRADVTDTPAFRGWFGNSKMIDGDGRPQVMYHITTGDFSQFTPGGADANLSGPAIWLTPDKGNQNAAHNVGGFYGKFRDGANVMPLYVKMERPLYITDQHEYQEANKQFNLTGGFPRALTQGEVEAIRARGYDGIYFASYNSAEGYDLATGRNVEVIVFDGGQLKSATGNWGTFDPDDPDIRFSRVGDSINATWESLRSAATLGKITANLNEVRQNHKDFNHFNWYDKSFSTQYNKARKDADFARVFDAAQQQSDDTARYAIEGEVLAPDVLVRLEGFGAIVKALRKGGKRHTADMNAIAKPLFANIEGVQGVGQRVYSSRELERDFGLNPQQIDMYRQVRASVDTSIVRLAQTAVMAVGQAQGIAVAHMKDMSLEDTAALVKEALWDREREKHFADVVMAEAEGKAPPRYFEPDMTHLDNIDGIAETATFLQESGYMPAMRFGEFAITVRDPRKAPGQDVVAFETYDDEIPAHRAAARLARQHPGMTVTRSRMNDEQYRMFKGVSPETVMLFGRFMGLDKEQAYHDYIALALSAKAARKHELARAGVPGFSRDLVRVMAAFLLSNARQSAINVNGQNLSAALAAPALQKKGDVQKEAQRLVDYVANPNEEARRLRGFMFMYYIGGSVASALVNLTQPVLQTLPWLTEFVGARAASVALAAARMAATGNVAPHLRHALSRADADGLTQPKEIHMMMGDATGSVLSSHLTLRALTQAWGGFFGKAEQFNRRLTFLAAYQAALDMGKEAVRAKGFEDAYDFAKRALAETQGLYSKVNRPNFGRGPIGSVLMTFRQFSITYLEMLMRMPWQQRLVALALLTLGAGVEGWPFAENLEDVIDTLGQSLGYNTNSKKELRNLVGPWLMHGLSGMTGAELSGRIGLGRMFPGTQQLKLSDARRDTNDLGGPFGSLMQAAHDAAMAAQAGNLAGPSGAAAKLLPTALKNMAAGVQMGFTGHYHDSTGRATTATTFYDAALKFFGFQPTAVARESEVVGDINQDRSMMGAIHAQLVQRWAHAIAEHDPERVAATVARWQQWNRDNPGYRITITPAQLRARVSELLVDRKVRTLKSTPPTMRAEAVAALHGLD
jgi:N12 class adenine-specific DNA methylase